MSPLGLAIFTACVILVCVHNCVQLDILHIVPAASLRRQKIQGESAWVSHSHKTNKYTSAVQVYVFGGEGSWGKKFSFFHNIMYTHQNHRSCKNDQSQGTHDILVTCLGFPFTQHIKYTSAVKVYVFGGEGSQGIPHYGNHRI